MTTMKSIPLPRVGDVRQPRPEPRQPKTWPADVGNLKPVDVRRLEGRLNFRLPLQGIKETSK
jgi:hypothetical protein